MNWEQWDRLLNDYVRYLKAIGRPPTTINLRKHQIKHLAKSLNLAPDRITGDDLINWLGIHEWKVETRRSYNAALRGFFSWAAKVGHITNDPATQLPHVKPGKSVPRPAPDHVLATAVQAADKRVGLMLRIAAEAGLRRIEVARVHTRDLRDSPSGPQLLVHGKGNRERVIPISEGLAAAIVAGAAGTPRGRP